MAAQKVLSAAVRTGERFGAQHLIDVLLGAKTEKVERNRHDRLTAPAPLVRTRIGLLGRRIVGAIAKLALLLRELDGAFDIALHMTITATMVNSARAMNAY